MQIFKLVPILLMFVLAACATQQSDTLKKTAAEPRDFFFAIKTEDPEVQRLFERGVVLTYGFNHQEAHNVYMHAAAQDSDCAMCYWGAALVLGPNINKPMDPRKMSRLPTVWRIKPLSIPAMQTLFNKV